MATLKNSSSYENVLSYLWKYIWPSHKKSRFYVCLAFFFLILSKGVTITIPFFLKNIVDDVSCIAPKISIAPFLLILCYGLARFLSQVFSDFKDILFAWIQQRAFRFISVDVFRKLHQLSLRYHLDRKTGGISRSIERGVKSVETFMRFSIFLILPSFFEVILVSIILWNFYEWYYAIMLLSMLLIYGFFTFYITQWRLTMIRDLNQLDTISNAKAVDSLLNYETVKYFSNEQLEENQYNARLKEYQKISFKSKMSLGFLNMGQGFIISLGLIIIMFFVIWDIQEGSKTVGDFVLLNTYLLQVYLPLGNLGFAYREIKLALANMESMFGIFNEKQEVKNCLGASPLLLKKGETVFENVSFSYTPDRSILKNVSFQIPSGRTVALVGASGGGKSTISRLIFRFYDVIEGRILIDNQDIRHATQESVRKSIGIVPQDTVLFNESLYYNLSYGNPKATPKEVHEAARLAHLDSFIKSLPKGYDTEVGERGLKLSGGEKQRVAIARVILKNPCIYLFDEATSALDTRTEKEIQKNLQEISEKKTTLIIAHRLSTVVHADQIFVLDHGEIVERGTHGNLLKKEGIYARMWCQQN